MSSQVEGLQPPDRRSLVGSTGVLRALVDKELKVKYKRSVLGVVWSLITPVALTLVYFFVFVKVWRVPTEDFGLFLVSGLLAWNYFNMSLLSSTSSIVDNAPLVRKVYFPRFLLPVSAVMANLLNFLIGLGVLSVFVIFTGRPIWLHLHTLLLAIFLETLLCVGVGLAFSVWNVYLRDIKQLIGILSLLLFFATPVVYDLPQVPEGFRPLLLANPLTPIMHIYRAALFEASLPEWNLVVLGTVETLIVLAIGWIVFKRLALHLAKEV